MRRFFMLLMATALIGAVSCTSDDEVDNGGVQQPPKLAITLDSTTSDFTAEGGSAVVSFTSSGAWTAEMINSRADSWCSIDPTSGSAGEAAITITTTPNETPDDRTASVIIKTGTVSKSVIVSQKQKDALTLTASRFELTAEGGEVTIEIKANVDFTHEIDESAEAWISYGGTRALKTSNLCFKVAPNEETAKREGVITIRSGSLSEQVTIYQEGEKPTIVLSKSEYIVSAAGETIAVEVKSNVDVSVEIQADVDWISENTTRALSTNTYRFDIAENLSYDQRTAQILFTNKANNLTEKVTVVQSQKDAIVLAKSEYEFEFDGGELDFEIQTNVEVAATISDNAKEWILPVDTRALESKKLRFEISPCSADESREGTITLTGGSAKQTITVKQSGMYEELEKERQALIAIYNALDGDNWSRNENWCSDKPVSEWEGIETTWGTSLVSVIDLSHNNLKGTLYLDLLNFKKLERLILQDNPYSSQLEIVFPSEKPVFWKSLSELDLCGVKLFETIPECLFSFPNLSVLNMDFKTIPSNIGNLSNLQSLFIHTEESFIPSEISQLNKLTDLSIAGDGIPDNGGVIPESIGNLGKLSHLYIENMDLRSGIPSSIGNLTKLHTLYLGNNNLTGSIPAEIGDLGASLYDLLLSNNKLSGSLPNSISQLTNLSRFYIGGNNLSGSLPDEMGVIFDNLFEKDNRGKGWMDRFDIGGNRFSGQIPVSITSHANWKYVWWPFINSNYFDTKGVVIPGPTIQGVDINGATVDTDTVYSENALTLLYQLQVEVASVPQLSPNVETVKALYDQYKGKNLHVICWGQQWEELAELKTFQNEYGLNEWSVIEAGKDYINGVWYYPVINQLYPYLCMVDSSGNIVYDQQRDGLFTLEELSDFVANVLGGSIPDYYTSSDYSQDGKVTALQTATVGEGIDVVLMGDGYSDRQIADGTYQSVMERAYNNLFTEEPYRSHKEYFNVYYVNAVSATEGYDYGNTAFSGFFGDGTLVGGNDNAVFTYALKAVSAERMNEALLVVMMNSENYGGTCYMYYPTSGDAYGSGVSVSYFPVGADEETFAQLLHHEANGHGFPKLADEYAYEELGAFPSDQVATYQEQQSGWGWWQNVDFTSDANAVLWAKFLDDSRYANEGLGLFEGGLTYWSGVWRPTENSIMRYNTGGFNAPSREAIYKRIHHLAYGESWEYDYEEFVAWDAVNRTAAARAARRAAAQTQKGRYVRQMPAPPVVVSHSWREAK